MPSSFPAFQPRERSVGSEPGVRGTVTRTTQGRENWVGDGCIGCLKAATKLVFGRWYRRDESWEFVPDESDEIDAIVAQREWEVLDGYWGKRAEIVLDQDRRWIRARFETTHAVRLQGSTGALTPLSADDGSPATLPAIGFPAGATTGGSETGDAEVLGSGWDHEHCAICWEKVGHDGQAEGYVSGQRTWVCERCYRDFVESRSLGFIPSV